MWSRNHTHARTHTSTFLFFPFLLLSLSVHTKYFLSSMLHTSCISLPVARSHAPQIEWFKGSMVYHLGWEVFMYFNSELTTPRDSKMDEIIIKNLILMIRRGPVSHARGGRLITTWLVMKKRALLCLEGLSSGTNERVPNCTIASSTSSKITPVNLLF